MKIDLSKDEIESIINPVQRHGIKCRAKEVVRMSNRDWLMSLYAMAEGVLLKKGYRLHHIASKKGYRSRTHWTPGSVEEYDGRFGRGYTIKIPRWDTTRYYEIRYYI